MLFVIAPCQLFYYHEQVLLSISFLLRRRPPEKLLQHAVEHKTCRGSEEDDGDNGEHPVVWDSATLHDVYELKQNIIIQIYAIK